MSFSLKPIDSTNSPDPTERSFEKKRPSSDVLPTEMNPPKSAKRAQAASEADLINGHAPIPAGPFSRLPPPFQKTGIASGMPYIGCNEENQSAILQLVTDNSWVEPEKKVHLGFSVWFNFDLISVSKPAYAIICDIDNSVIEIYEALQACILKSDNALEFTQNFHGFLIANADKYFGNLPETEIPKIFDAHAELTRPGSWLQTPDKFMRVKELHAAGRVHYLNLNITDQSGAFRQLDEWMQENELELDTLYASNIVEWMTTGPNKEAYLANLKQITSAKTRFIHAYKPDPFSRSGPVLELGIGQHAVAIPSRKPSTKAAQSRRISLTGL